jgi:hypothetical protein
MKIKATQVQAVEVEVSEVEILEHAMRIVRNRAGIQHGDFLKDGKVMYDDPDHRHGSISEYERRVATESDLEAFAVIKHLHGLRWVKI